MHMQITAVREVVLRQTWSAQQRFKMGKFSKFLIFRKAYLQIDTTV